MEAGANGARRDSGEAILPVAFGNQPAVRHGDVLNAALKWTAALCTICVLAIAAFPGLAAIQRQNYAILAGSGAALLVLAYMLSTRNRPRAAVYVAAGAIGLLPLVAAGVVPTPTLFPIIGGLIAGVFLRPKEGAWVFVGLSAVTLLTATFVNQFDATIIAEAVFLLASVGVVTALNSAIHERDVSDITELAGDLKHQAHHDHLTGLPNRAAASDTLARACARAIRQGTELCVAYLDLADFKASTTATVTR